jgi:hypothetical protein
VAGARAADLLVERVRREPARVADRGGVDAVGAPEDPLRAPEATHAHDRALEALGERRLERRAEDVVLSRHDHPLVPSRESERAVDHLLLLAGEKEHVAHFTQRPQPDALTKA